MVSDIKRDIPAKLDTVLPHSNWSSLRGKYLSKISTDINVFSCGLKLSKILGISDAISPALHPQKSSQRALRLPHVMAQFVLKIEKLFHIQQNNYV